MHQTSLIKRSTRTNRRRWWWGKWEKEGLWWKPHSNTHTKMHIYRRMVEHYRAHWDFVALNWKQSGWVWINKSHTHFNLKHILLKAFPLERIELAFEPTFIFSTKLESQFQLIQYRKWWSNINAWNLLISSQECIISTLKHYSFQFASSI